MKFFALLFAILSAPLFGQLSDAEWRQATQELAEALQSGNTWGVHVPLETIGRDDSSRAVKILAKVFPDVAEDISAYEVVRDAIAGLNNRDALKKARSEAVKARGDMRTKICFLEGLAERGEDEDFATLVKALKDKDETVQITVIRILGRSRRRDVIEPLIALMVTLDETRGGVWEDCGAALGRLTGQQLTYGLDFESWMSVQEDDFEVADPDAWAPRVDTDDGSTVTFFGQSITLDNIVFIIDVSGSMETTDPFPRGYGGSTTRGDEEGPDVERMRIFRAKKELKKVLDALEPRVKFNILAYSSNVTEWKRGGELHKASNANIQAAKDWVDGLDADGVTVTDDALRQGLTIEGVQGIYLLSDGFATADGKNKIPTENILQIVQDGNRFRKAKIYTFGFEGADEELMVALARETGGSYRFIEW